MKTLLLSTLVLHCALAYNHADLKHEFSLFKQKYNKQYSSSEEEYLRFNIFKENLISLTRESRESRSYTVGVTQFSDMTHQEFKNTYLGLKQTNMMGERNMTARRVSSNLPDQVNWVEQGAVSSVKNQGQCGSCWAFATTEQVESYAQISSGGEVPNLSAQQVTSCTPNLLQCGGTGGCYGSVTQLGFNYLQLFGHMSEDDYPYVSGSTSNTEDCNYDVTKPVVKLTGYNTLPSNDHDAVMTHLAEVGPLSIAVDASEWHKYTGGVFNGCSFDDNISINHGVQLVGYGSAFSAAGVYDYWLVRNSWGTSWGEDGYIRLQRTSQCGVNSTPMDGTACVDGPGTDQQTVCGMCGMLLDCSYPIGVQKL